MNFTNDWRDQADSVKDKLKYALTNENTHHDVAIIVGSGSLETFVKAHSFMLILGSQVFEKLLEKAKVNNEGFKEIKMPDVRPEAMKFVLKYIYTDYVNMEDENALDILYVALELNLRHLAILCISKLRGEISVQNVLRILEKAVKMNVAELVQATQDFILKNARDVFQQEEFLNITKESLCKFLASNELEMDEVPLFKFILRWGEAECERLGRGKNRENLRFALEKVLPLIRYTLMTSHQFATVVVQTNILDDKEVIDVYNYLSVLNSDAYGDIELPQWIFSSVARKFTVGEHSTVSTNNETEHNSDAPEEHDNSENTVKGRLLKYLKEITQKKTICGIFCTSESITVMNSVETIQNITGVQPGILTLKMPSYWDEVAKWQSFTEEIISHWKNRFLIRVVWWEETGHPLTRFEVFRNYDETKWQDLTDKNGHLNKVWKNVLDNIAPFFKRLQNAGVVVICDLLPYINCKEFLWRGRPGNDGSLKLYQITHDYLTQHHDLNSILWTWSLKISGDLTKLDEFYPGDNYVDIASVHINNKRQLDIAVYGKLLDVIGRKPISMEFPYTVPTPDLLVKLPGWTWFSVSDDTDGLYDDSMRTTFNSLSVISKENNEFFSHESILAERIRINHASVLRKLAPLYFSVQCNYCTAAKCVLFSHIIYFECCLKDLLALQ